jgi:hypothetical protein
VKTIQLDEFVNVIQRLAGAESTPTGEGTPSPASGDNTG